MTQNSSPLQAHRSISIRTEIPDDLYSQHDELLASPILADVPHQRAHFIDPADTDTVSGALADVGARLRQSSALRRVSRCQRLAACDGSSVESDTRSFAKCPTFGLLSSVAANTRCMTTTLLMVWKDLGDSGKTLATAVLPGLERP